MLFVKFMMEVTELPSHVSIYPYFPKEMFLSLMSNIGVMFAQGMFDLKPVYSLNEAFPGIKPKTVKELLEEAWKRQ